MRYQNGLVVSANALQLVASKFAAKVASCDYRRYAFDKYHSYNVVCEIFICFSVDLSGLLFALISWFVSRV